MNKPILFLVILVMTTSLSNAQKKSSKKKEADGSYILLGLSYNQPKRTEFDKYVSAISDSLKLKNALNVNKAYGAHFSFILKTGKSEFEAGLMLAKTLSLKEGNANNSAYALVNNNNFDIHFGYNNFLSKNVFWGFDIGALSNNGKITYEGTAANYFESTPESNNPFKGYQFIFRPKFGFKFRLGEQTSIRLHGYYDLGLTKYEFYTNDIFDTRLKNYKGNTKSSYNNLGLQFSFVFLL